MVGTSHTFYVHKTKKIVHFVDAVQAIAELGQKAGLRLDEIINIPLKKLGNLNARPRSTDKYSESVVVFSLFLPTNTSRSKAGQHRSDRVRVGQRQPLSAELI